MGSAVRILYRSALSVVLLWLYWRRTKDLGPCVIALPRTGKNMVGPWALLALGVVLAIAWFFIDGVTLNLLFVTLVVIGLPVINMVHAGKLCENGLHTFGVKAVFWTEVEWFSDRETFIRLRLTRRNRFDGFFDIPISSDVQKEELLAFLRSRGSEEDVYVKQEDGR